MQPSDGAADETREGPPSGVLAYATPAARGEWVRPPRWLRRAVVAASGVLLALFLLGLPPLAGSLDYTRDIPLREAVAYAGARGVGGTLDSVNMVCVAAFAPAAVASLAAFLCLRGVWPQRVAVLANVALPAFWLLHFWPFLVVGGPVILVRAVAGQCDGETWSEGFISYSAIASWTTLWGAVAGVLGVVRRKRSRETRRRAGRRHGDAAGG